jgi:hypothetical protein
VRPRGLITLLPVAFVALVPGIAAAATPPTFPILPNQYFEGVVNGQTAGATVYTACPGPTTGTGHPVSGQTLSVSRVSQPSTTDVGFTGSLGTSVEATPVLSLVNAPVKFVEYFRSSELPTTWTVPCEGDGRIAFTPKPNDGSTARTDYVTLRFVNIATTSTAP